MRKIITFTVTTLLMASAFGAGEIYRWKGADGTWHYSDQQRPGAELVRGGRLPRPSESNAQAATPPALPAEAPMATADENLPVSDDVAGEVRAAAAAAKTEQCKKYEDMYQKAIQARRIHKTDAQGNRVYMNESELDAARLQARANRDLACGSGG